MRLTAEQRQAASTLRNLMGGATALLAGGAAMPPPLGPIVGHLVVGTGAMGWLTDRYANDPPDRDFDRAAEPSPDVIPLERLKVAGGLPVPIVSFAGAINQSYGYVAAALRAFERAQGAQRAHDLGATQSRLDETTRYARSGAAATDRLAHSWDGLAGFVEAIPQFPSYQPLAVPRIPTELPQSTLASLFLSGVTRAALKRALDAERFGSGRSSTLTPAGQLREMQGPTEAFALFLSSWEPAAQIR